MHFVVTKGKISFLLKWLIGLCLVWYLLMKIDISKVVRAFVGADLTWLLTGCIVIILIRILMAWQLKMVVQHQDVDLTIARAFAINLITGFYGLILPGDMSAGIMRWHKLSKPSGKRAEVLAALVFLRLINSTVILLFGIIALLIDNPFDNAVVSLAAIAFLAGMIVIYSSIFSERVAVRIERCFRDPFPGMAPFIWEKLRRVWSALAQYRVLSKSNLVKITSVSLLNLFSSIALFLILAKALHLTIPIIALVWIRAMVLIIQLIPVSIAGLGIREGALVFILPIYGISPPDAMAFSLLFFGLIIVIGLVGGILEANEVLIEPLRRPLAEDGPEEKMNRKR